MAPRTHRTALAALALALLAATCGAVPEKRYYAVVNDPGPPAEASGVPACARPIVIPAMEIAVPYDNDRIVFRSDGFEVKYHNYDLWVSRPQDMFQQLLSQKLERARVFSAVEPQIASSRDHLALLATIDAVELIARGEHLEARLAMTLRLRDTAAEATVWEHAFDSRRPVVADDRGDAVGETVRTLSAIYNAEADNAVQLLERFASTYPGCAPGR
jgi:ABC-type uncharacterized transport system auxiliary subunit